MSQKRKFAILFLIIAIIATTPIFARVKTKHFSAYAACQKRVLTIKGNKAWEYQRTIPGIFSSQINYSDGQNFLHCIPDGIGPFWIALITIHSCFGNIAEICPSTDDYD